MRCSDDFDLMKICTLRLYWDRAWMRQMFSNWRNMAPSIVTSVTPLSNVSTFVILIAFMALGLSLIGRNLAESYA